MTTRSTTGGGKKRMQQLRAVLLKLPMKQRAELAAILIASLDEPAEPSTVDYTEEWAKEAQRRYEAYKQGRIPAIPAEEVFREVRARLRTRPGHPNPSESR